MNYYYMITLVFAIRSLGSCYKSNCVPLNLYVEAPTLRVTVFEDRNLMEVIELNEVISR